VTTPAVEFPPHPGSAAVEPPRQLPNEQQKPPQNASPNPARPFPRSRTLLVAGVAVLGLVAALSSLQWRGNPFGRKPSFSAIAILPFESLSHGADQQYLADGMTEALITNLGQAGPLRVIARTSVNQYRRTKKPVREIARELNVDVVVEGTITHSGDRIRVTANLIQVSPERHIWAHTYERNSIDTLALQNEIAGAIAAEIQGKLTPHQQSRLASSRPVNPDAQLAYWKARYFLHGGRDSDPEGAMKSVEYSEQAVRIDPGYAPAYAGLARSYARLSYVDRAVPGEAMTRARTAAKRAIALDEDLAEAHVALATVFLNYDWDWAGAEREVRHAIRLNPSDAEAHHILVLCLAAVGRVDEAVVEVKRVRQLDPLSFRINWEVGRMLYFARKYDEALTELRRAADMQPDSSAVAVYTVKSYLKKGLDHQAVAVDLRMRGDDGLNREALGALRVAFSTKGLPGYFGKLKQLLGPRLHSSVYGSYYLAEINTYLDDKEEAFRWLEEAFHVRSALMPWIKVDPSLDPLRSDPRFGALLRRMGLPQ
jgi:TolB-like protein